MLQQNRSEFFNAYAEDLETAIHAGILTIDVREISSYIRRQLIESGLPNLIVRAKDVLPAKYKLHEPREDDGNAYPSAPNSSLNIKCPKCGQVFTPTATERAAFRASCPNRACKAILKLPNPEEENAPYLKLIKEVVGALGIVYDKMRKEPFVSKLDRADVKESLQVGYGLTQFLLEAFDDRQGVPAATQQLLLDAAIRYNIEEAAGYYFTDVKDKDSLTRKQTRKIVTFKILGATRNNGEYDPTRIKDLKGKLHLMLEPRNAYEARKANFSGVQCEKCASWRTESSYLSVDVFRLHCLGCDHWFERPFVMPYKGEGKELTTGPDGKVKATPVK